MFGGNGADVWVELEGCLVGINSERARLAETDNQRVITKISFLYEGPRKSNIALILIIVGSSLAGCICLCCLCKWLSKPKST